MSNKLPPALVRRLSEDPTFDAESFLGLHDSEQRITAIRLNPAKPLPSWADTAGFERVPWCSTGFYLPDRPVFTLDPFFHAGCYYVQEPSSMFVAHVLSALELDREPLMALDLCAAPGGKSTLLNSHLHPESLLVANEPIKSRVNILSGNLVQWGHPNTVTTNSDSSAFGRLPGFFDLLLVDAPCSGSGMLRKDGQALDHWSEAAVKLCRERQQRILSHSLPSLKSGGILLYSTCSYSIEENEEIADWLTNSFGLESVSIPIDPAWGIIETRSPEHACAGYRFYPHKVRGEGFYLAAFRQTGTQRTIDSRRIKTDKNTIPTARLSPWVENPSTYHNFLVNQDVHVFPERYKTELASLRNVLYLKNAGIKVGKYDGDRIIPDHALAMSMICNKNLPSLSLDRDQALNYLRKNPIPTEMNSNNHQGWLLIKHDSAVLGWGKAIAGRINNYYPKEQRIVHL